MPTWGANRVGRKLMTISIGRPYNILRYLSPSIRSSEKPQAILTRYRRDIDRLYPKGLHSLSITFNYFAGPPKTRSGMLDNRQFHPRKLTLRATLTSQA